MSHKLFGEYLLDANLITSEQLQRALELQMLQLLGTNARLGTVLLQLGAIDEQHVARALERQQEEWGTSVNPV